MSTPHALLLVTGDGCDSSDAVYGSFAEALRGVRDACVALQDDYSTPVSFSDPIDGHGVIYTLTPELWVLFRYQISEEPDDDDDAPVSAIGDDPVTCKHCLDRYPNCGPGHVFG